jgi:hypothetical protein
MILVSLGSAVMKPFTVFTKTTTTAAAADLWLRNPCLLDGMQVQCCIPELRRHEERFQNRYIFLTYCKKGLICIPEGCRTGSHATEASKMRGVCTRYNLLVKQICEETVALKHNCEVLQEMWDHYC